MQKPNLDPRLLMAADFFPYCQCGADVGADHGHLSCYLLSTGKCKTMQITDISATSLQKAEALIRRHGFSDRATFGVGDGLKALEKPADAIAICGMGGHTLSGILENGRDHLGNAKLILSPQTELPLVRETLYRKLGYHIEREEVVLAAKRYYVMMLAAPGQRDVSEKALYLGAGLMQLASETYLQYLNWRVGVVSREQTQASAVYIAWLKEELHRVQCAIDRRNG